MLPAHAGMIRPLLGRLDPAPHAPRARGDDPALGPSAFRLDYIEPYSKAARTWLHAEAVVIDTTHLTPAQAARHIAEAVNK